MAVETVTGALEPDDFGEEARSGNALGLYAETARRRPDALAIEMDGWTITTGTCSTAPNASPAGSPHSA